MTYQEMNSLPEYERVQLDDAGKILPASPGKARWGAAEPPPPLGTPIIVTINNCGPAIVTGYFVQDDFLGLRCRLLDAPEWHRRQNKGDPNGHVFGPEFRAPKPLERGAVWACSWGHEQTNVDFYRVEKVSDAFVTLQKIESKEESDGELSLTGRVVPALPHWADGPPIRRKVKMIGSERPFFQPTSYAYAYPWDGRPMRVSHYA